MRVVAMAFLDRFKDLTIIKKSRVEELQKGLDDLETIKNYIRPQDNNFFLANNRAMSWGINDQHVTAYDLYELSITSDILINILTTLKNEMFRGGFERKPTVPYENKLQLDKMKNIERRANFNNQRLVDVFMELEKDLDVFDDAYLFARKEFFIGANNQIIGGEVLEFLRIDPFQVEMLFDDTSRIGYDKNGKGIFFDPENRTQFTDKEFRKDGRRNMRACYRVKTGVGEGKSSGSYTYYDASEILHISKYNPTKTYGFSILYSLYNKIVTLINMDYYIKQYYSGDKVPKGMLVVNTQNASSFKTWWDVFTLAVRKNPHTINPLVHQSAGDKNSIQWIDFMRNLQEMQYTDVRNEIRTQIAAPFNVSPIFQNDTSTGGGLNNEGLQITVTDRGVEMGQSIFNDKVLLWMREQLGISDYEWTLKPSKELDKIAEKELRIKDIQIARETAALGIEVTMNETGEFSYRAGKVEKQTPHISSFSQDIGGASDEAEAAMSVAKSFQGKDLTKSGDSNLPLPLPKNAMTQAQAKEVENALLNELEKLLKRFDAKTVPSKEELDKKISETIKEFDSVVKTKSSKKLKAIYIKAMNDLGKELGRTFTLNDVDKNVIEALKREPVYQEAFANVSKRLSEKLKTVIVDAYSQPGGLSMSKLVDEMRNEAEDVEANLKTIARTETSKISVASRKVQYEKTGDVYKYYHIGPNDERTTPQSKEIVELTKDGVTWDQYVNIVQEVAKKYIPNWVVNPVAPISHPNTRHTFIARRA